MRIVYYVHFSLVIKEYNFTYISTCVYYVQVQLYLHIICTLLNAYCVMCCLYTSTKHIKLKFCTCKCIIFIFNSFLTLDQYFLLYQLQSYWEALGDFSNHVDKVLVTVQCSSIVQQYSEQCCRLTGNTHPLAISNIVLYDVQLWCARVLCDFSKLKVHVHVTKF